MSEKKKKLFPKLKKKLQDFLTDESGEITKKDALGIAAGAAVLSIANDVNSEDSDEDIKKFEFSSGSYGSASGTCRVYVQVKHVSGIVNGHISQKPEIEVTTSHSSHGSHGSHCNSNFGGSKLCL